MPRKGYTPELRGFELLTLHSGVLVRSRDGHAFLGKSLQSRLLRFQE